MPSALTAWAGALPRKTAVPVITVCCFQGYFTRMHTDSYGAKSVSLSTTSAVVISCVMILIADYVVTFFIV